VIMLRRKVAKDIANPTY